MSEYFDFRLHDTEASRLEIAILALGILLLVVQLSILLCVGIHHRESKQRPLSLAPHHRRSSDSCLWRDVFPDQREHGLVLDGGQAASVDDVEEATLVQRLRKKSEVVAAAMHHELMEIRRRVSSNTEIDPSMRDVEVGIMSGVSISSYPSPSPGTMRERADSLMDVLRTGADVLESCMQRSPGFMRQYDDEETVMV